MRHAGAGKQPQQPEDASLADAVRETIASTREHLLDFIRLDETPPPTAMTLAQW
ncbi:hypothetical protein ONO77_15405, partial [Salmonella enterica subsp. enterica serovar Montevideo]|nr:hypothetical protein [Salmonella enterica subsp. enterica serovar Montevideo]